MFRAGHTSCMRIKSCKVTKNLRKWAQKSEKSFIFCRAWRFYSKICVSERKKVKNLSFFAEREDFIQKSALVSAIKGYDIDASILLDWWIVRCGEEFPTLALAIKQETMGHPLYYPPKKTMLHPSLVPKKNHCVGTVVPAQWHFCTSAVELLYQRSGTDGRLCRFSTGRRGKNKVPTLTSQYSK